MTTLTYVRTIDSRRRVVIPRPIFRNGQGCLRVHLYFNPATRAITGHWREGGATRVHAQNHRIAIPKDMAEILELQCGDDMRIEETATGFTIKKVGSK